MRTVNCQEEGNVPAGGPRLTGGRKARPDVLAKAMDMRSEVLSIDGMTTAFGVS